MKVMIMAGGTGGHIFPAAAVAEQFESSGWSVRWLGSKYGMEGKLVPALGFEFCSLPVTAWHGGRLRKLFAPLNLVKALWSGYWILRRERPDVVIGFGGYASAPGGVAAVLLRKMLVLHEQNGVPGLTNKRLAKYANKVLQAFPNTFVEPYEVVGNPVRKTLCHFDSPVKRQIAQHRNLRVLVLGGSQGAESINALVPNAVAQMKGAIVPEIWHQSGQNKAASCQKSYESSGVEATVVEFIEDMAAAYRWADVVIARSGASTVSELAAVGLYSILIPYPWHGDKQQYRNADWLAQANAAEWHEQAELTTALLADRLNYLQNHRSILVERASNAWHLGVRDSAQRIFKIVEELMKSKAV